VITIRNQSLGAVTCRLVAWERPLVQLDAQREQLDAQQLYLGARVPQQ
jgi:hypothetical protein